MLVLDILNDFRGEALPSRDKKKNKTNFKVLV